MSTTNHIYITSWWRGCCIHFSQKDKALYNFTSLISCHHDHHHYYYDWWAMICKGALQQRCEDSNPSQYPVEIIFTVAIRSAIFLLLTPKGEEDHMFPFYKFPKKMTFWRNQFASFGCKTFVTGSYFTSMAIIPFTMRLSSLLHTITINKYWYLIKS